MVDIAEVSRDESREKRKKEKTDIEKFKRQ